MGYTVKADSKYNDWEDINYYSFQIIDNKGRILVDNRDWDDIEKDLAKKVLLLRIMLYIILYTIWMLIREVSKIKSKERNF